MEFWYEQRLCSPLSNSSRINQEVAKQWTKFIFAQARDKSFILTVTAASSLVCAHTNFLPFGGTNEKIEIIKDKYNLVGFYDTSEAGEMTLCQTLKSNLSRKRGKKKKLKKEEVLEGKKVVKNYKLVVRHP